MSDDTTQRDGHAEPAHEAAAQQNLPPVDDRPEAFSSTEHDAGARVARRGETFWGWVRDTARLWGFFAFILLILVTFRQVILPFVLAVLVTYVLAPVLRVLSRVTVVGKPLPRLVWLLALYAVLAGVTALFITLFVPRLAHDTKRIVREAPHLVQKVKRIWLPSVARWVDANFGEEEATVAEREPSAPAARVRRLEDGTFELDPRGLQLEVLEQEDGRWVVRSVEPADDAGSSARIEGVLSRYVGELVATSEGQVKQLVALGQRFLLGLMGAITTFILVLMISAFLLMDTERMLCWMRNLVPHVYHHDFDVVVQLIDRALSGAIRGQLLICVVNGVLTGIGLMLIGVKYALLLSLLAGVMSLIPIFGSILSSIPIVAVALASGSEGIDLTAGLMTLAWIVGIHLVEANLLNPKIIGVAARIHPVIVIFAVVAGQRTYGPMGALLAVPIVSAVQATFIYVRAKVRGEMGPGQTFVGPGGDVELGGAARSSASDPE